MSINTVCEKIDDFWLSKGYEKVRTEKGYYSFFTDNWKLYMYPQDVGVDINIIPQRKKYQITRNMNIETELGVMLIDTNPARSNPSLVFGIHEKDLNNVYIDQVINGMVHIVENHFDTIEKNQ